VPAHSSQLEAIGVRLNSNGSKANERIIRILKVARFLLSGDCPTGQELADRFDVDLRTMRRDLALLQEAGWDNFDGNVKEMSDGGVAPNGNADSHGAILRSLDATRTVVTRSMADQPSSHSPKSLPNDPTDPSTRVSTSLSTP
jgi:HTH domain